MSKSKSKSSDNGSKLPAELIKALDKSERTQSTPVKPKGKKGRRAMPAKKEIKSKLTKINNPVMLAKILAVLDNELSKSVPKSEGKEREHKEEKGDE